jgi:O-antigen/teichoic acid export membrane protein
MRAAVIPALRWTALGRLTAQALSLAATLAVVRILSPADYGLFALCMAPSTFFGALVVVAPTSLTIQRREHGDRQAAEIAGLLLALAGVAFLLVVAALAAIAWSYGEAQVWPLGLALAAGVFWPSCVTGFLQSRFERRLEFRLVSLFELAAGVAGAGTTIGCAFAGAGVWSLAAGSCCAAMLQCLLLLHAGGFPSPSFRLGRLLREDAGYGAHVTLGTLVTQVFDAAETLLLGRLLGTGGLGAWRTARELVNVPLAKVMPIVNRVGFPAYARLGADFAAIRRYTLLSLRVLAAFFLPVYWGIAAVAPHAVPAVLGGQWAEAVPVAVLFGGFMPVKLLQYCLLLPHQGLGNAAHVNRAMLGIGGSALVGLALGAPFGLAAAALGMAAAGTLGVAVAADRARRPLGISWRDLGEACGASLAAAAAMAIAVSALRLTLVDGSWSHPQALALLVPAGAAVFVAVFLVADRGATPAVLAALMRDVGARR